MVMHITILIECNYINIPQKDAAKDWISAFLQNQTIGSQLPIYLGKKSNYFTCYKRVLFVYKIND